MLYVERLIESDPLLSPQARQSLPVVLQAIEDVAATVARLLCVGLILAGIGVSIGVALRLTIGIIRINLSVELSAALALYGPPLGGTARISLWMRTAAKDQVVRFRTFLRTLVHELCHHLDYEHFGLAETFHTQGFYNRESALVRDLVGERR